MTETTLSTKENKLEKHYTNLVNQFLADEKYKGVDDQEKKKFLSLCVVNQLNPYKKEAYAVPYGKTLQMTVDYHQFLQRAEATGKLS